MIATENGHNGEEKQGYKAQTCMIGIRGMFSYTDRKNATAELPLGGDSLKSLGWAGGSSPPFTTIEVRENTTRKVYKDSAKPESVSDKRGGGSLDQAAKSDHKHIAEVQRVAWKQSVSDDLTGEPGQQRDNTNAAIMRPITGAR